MKPFWSNGRSALQRALGWFWIPTGRSRYLVPSLYPEMTSNDDLTSTLTTKQHKHRKKRNTMARASRKANR